MEKTKKNQITAIIYLVLGGLSIIYDIILLCLANGKFFPTFFSFIQIWLLLGAFFIFLGMFRLKKNKSFWSILRIYVKIPVIVITFAIGTLFVVNLYSILTPKISTKNESAEFVILLGGGIDKNGKLPALVEKRVQTAYEYLTIHEDSVCIVTGGILKDLPYAEAPALKNMLVSYGIDEKRILVEDKALDTIQNLKYTCNLLSEYEKCSQTEILNRSFMIVTNRFHLSRAEKIADNLGFSDIKGLAAPENDIRILHMYIREICAYVKLHLRFKLNK